MRRLLPMAFFLSACASNLVLPGIPTVSGISMTCNKPFVLEQDCSNWSGAKRLIEVQGFEVKVAGSGDGRTIVVMDKSPMTNSALDGLTLGLGGFHSDASNDGYNAIKAELQSHDIQIGKVTAIVTLGRIDGYILELDGDGYSILKPLSK